MANICGPTRMFKRSKEHHGIIMSGHRGGQKGHEPENTIRAFERAIDMGIQMVELDVSSGWKVTVDSL